MNTHTIRAPRASRLLAALAVSLTAVVAACGDAPDPDTEVAVAAPVAGSIYVVPDTTIDIAFAASGVAGPIRQATLSTKLMGTVLEVLVNEGDRVVADQPLLRIDARDLGAKSAQTAAGIASAEAMYREALTQTERIRAMYADSAATRAQLDAVEAGLARAEAGLRAARAAEVEVDAARSYATIRAPFTGIVTKRFADPGTFASPGAPLLAVQDVSQLRVSASVTPDIARALRRGQALAATIEGRPMRAIIEGVVPAGAGNLATVNALVANPGGTILAGSAATLALPMGTARTLVVPAAAISREGDLTSVTLRTAGADERRWVRLGRAAGGMVEVTAGLRAGDRVVLPAGHVTATVGN
jgi:RND family efflux transporter MFP subunit